jgi:calcium binding protein 39
MIERLLAADLPAQLLSRLSLLSFEGRKDVTNLLCVLLRTNLPRGLDVKVTEYLQRQWPQVESSLLGAYADLDLVVFVGVVIRCCLRRSELLAAFLANRGVFSLVELVDDASFEVSADVLQSIKQLISEHREACAAWLEANFTEFFVAYHRLVRCDNYAVQRQALRLLSSLLLDRSFEQVMRRYIRDDKNLQVIMVLLGDDSRAIPVQAFHVFKIFVANPEMTGRVQKILYNNRERLQLVLQGLRPPDKNNRPFLSDLKLVIEKLRAMEMPSPSAAALHRSAAAPRVAATPAPQ